MPKMSSRLLPCFSLGHFCNDFAPCAVWIIGPAVAISMDLTPTELGLLFTIHSAGSALAYFPAGMVSDHISDRGKFLLVTFVWVAVGYFIASFAPNYWSLALLLAIAGIGDAVWHPVATGVLVQQYPESRAKALGVHAMGGSIAEVAGPLAVGFLLLHVDWRTALQICVIPTVIMAIVFIPIAAQVPKRDKIRITRGDFVSIWQTWRNRAGLRVIFLISSYNMALMALLSMVPFHLKRTYELDISTTALLFSGMLLVGAALQPMIGGVSDRLGRRPVVILGNVIASIAASAMFFAPGLVTLVAAQAVAIGTLVAIRSALLAASVEHAGKKEATTLGLAFALMDGIGALGALLAGLVGTIQLEYAFLLASGLSLLATVLALGMPRPAQSTAASV